ncbi:beta-fructofuranosidase, insoluble isoenzyme 1-like isoform X1 [Papaver somniferum]|uniref:beta-fructofuranosidase, insoluble isoenzyme 1-like isoform X1 n=1 Tax=Papaver somniferum TaxID=3469 RepID=UPI000E705E7F|nr:beta-fructofuranosidase, insoluble isoenzyme 1-like isoform X1 [Papaver somniferum]
MEILEMLVPLLLVPLWFSLLVNGVQASNKVLSEIQATNKSNAWSLYRTGYHFQPQKNWMNDPNGPMYYNGTYHLFYQYNPEGAVWGNIVWGHSVSKDMINWLPLNPAIYPSAPFDINGCWSGSATILQGNKPVIFYTGIDTENRQVQNIAVPKNLSDPFLEEWTKPDYNPLIEPINGINAASFRDPTTAWLGKDGYWRLVVGNESGNKTGMALLYKSKDFVKWVKVQYPLHSAQTGMWECPDFFPVSLTGKEGLDTSASGDRIKHVLKVSLGEKTADHYTVGHYLLSKDQYIPDNTSVDDSTGLRYDYGNFYASKSFFDASKKRRILWGWVLESDTKEDDIAEGWAGIQSVPRTLWLDKNEKQLLQWPVEELKSLRREEVAMTNISLTKGILSEVKGITASQADVEVTFHLPSLEKAELFDPTWVDAEALCGKKDATVQGGVGPFGLLALASKNLMEYTTVVFRVFKAQDKYTVLMCSGGVRSSLKPGVTKRSYGAFVDADLSDGKLSLRSLIDNSVIESFASGGKTCITSRVYPTLALGKNAHLYAFNNGTEAVEIAELKAWSIGRPKMNVKAQTRRKLDRD